MANQIPKRESFKVEFKSDRRRLSDRELAAAAVCLANADGGEIYLGVEPDGTPSGLHSDHGNVDGLTAMIANRTSPSLSVTVEPIVAGKATVARIAVPKSRELVATSEGLVQRRRVMGDGTAQCVPFFPHEFAGREGQLGIADYSARPVDGAGPGDLDPLERERLRQMIQRYGGDTSLLALSDEELDGALGLVRQRDGNIVPTVTGLLILGREDSLRTHVPTHELAFQVLQDTQVLVNNFYRAPLLRAFERTMDQIEARVQEDEVQVGLFRVPVPTLDKRSLREALVNAVVHRDYTRLGAVHVRWDNDGMSISNPGGLVEGVTVENLLVVEPKPRNPLLADVVKRIGLAERTGRGVDLIYQGLLRYGRPEPDYSRTDSTTVVVRLSSADADIPFLKMIVEEEARRGALLPLDSLIVLARLRKERRADAAELARAIQKDKSAARSALERLVEAGLVEAHGVKKGRTYTLSALVYQGLGRQADYVRQAGFGPIQQEQMVLTYVRQHGKIKRADVVGLCRLNPHQASRLLRKMTEEGLLTMFGQRKGAFYALGPKS